MAQTLAVYESAAYQTRKGAWVWASSAYQPWKGAWVYEIGAWHQFYTALALSGIASSYSTTQTSYSFSNDATPGFADVVYNIIGGVAPYTQTLAKVSGAAHTFVSGAGPSDPTTSRVTASTDSSSGVTGSFLLTVTDSLGNTATATFSVTFN